MAFARHVRVRLNQRWWTSDDPDVWCPPFLELTLSEARRQLMLAPGPSPMDAGLNGVVDVAVLAMATAVLDTSRRNMDDYDAL
jgi:hypothetical protein